MPLQIPTVLHEKKEVVNSICAEAKRYAHQFKLPVDHPFIEMTALCAWRLRDCLNYDPLLTNTFEGSKPMDAWVKGYRDIELQKLLMKVFEEFDMENFEDYLPDVWMRYDNVLAYYKELCKEPLPEASNNSPQPMRNISGLDAMRKYQAQLWKQWTDCVKLLTDLSKKSAPVETDYEVEVTVETPELHEPPIIQKPDLNRQQRRALQKQSKIRERSLKLRKMKESSINSKLPHPANDSDKLNNEILIE